MHENELSCCPCSNSPPEVAEILRVWSCRHACGQGLKPNLFAQSPGKSVQLHIYIEVKPGKGPDLEKLYHSAYVPAIKVQDGFLSTRLLRHYESNSKYEIDISFKTEKQRAAWAQSKEHQDAWPKVEELGAKITWQGFDQLA